MKDVFKHIKAGEKTYPFVFNINVTQEIVKKYGSIQAWAELMSTKNAKEEVSNELLDALKFFCKEAVNEGIDMENDPEDEHYIKRETPRPLINEKQAGRIMSSIEDFNQFAINTVIESNDAGKEKNVIAEQNQSPTTE